MYRPVLPPDPGSTMEASEFAEALDHLRQPGSDPIHYTLKNFCQVVRSELDDLTQVTPTPTRISSVEHYKEKVRYDTYSPNVGSR